MWKSPGNWALALYVTASAQFMPSRCVCQQASRRALIITALPWCYEGHGWDSQPSVL